MSENNVFDLDTLRNEVEREFAPMKLTVAGEEVVLRNPLRMPQKERETLNEAFQELDGLTTQVQEYQKLAEAAENDETVEVPEFDSKKVESAILSASKKIVKTAVGGKAGQNLLTALGDDLQLIQKLITVWAQQVKPGEASSSEN